MQTVKIDLYISDLLYSYDCVIVPDLGGFVANYAPAQIQSIQHKFSPPSKRISFNGNLKNNDGLLTNHIAERRSISYEEANGLIKGFVNQSLTGLEQGDKIHIEKVGTLYLDPEQRIQFKAEESNDFLLDSFGLTGFRALPIEREGAQERIQKKIQENAPLIKEEEKKRRKVYWPAAALIAVIILSSFILNYQFSWVDTQHLNYSFISADTKVNPRYVEEKVKFDTEPFKFEETSKRKWENGITPYTLEEEKTGLWVENTMDEKAPIDNTYAETSAKASGLRFHVMGGCFSQESNAKGLVNNLSTQGYQARLLGTYKNLHAVSYASYATREEAIRLLAKVRNHHNPDAWLLVKEF
ncbi:MAG: SPOR domain-containing protein [Vicingaceae bacterium]